MNEIYLQWISVIKLVFVFLSATLYAFGGISGKWKRRYVASAIAFAGVIITSLLNSTFSFWYLLYFPLLIGAWSTGYGADKTYNKILKRIRYSVLVWIASLPLIISNGVWGLGIVHLFLLLIVIVPLGVWGFARQARYEETIIGAVCVFLPMFMV